MKLRSLFSILTFMLCGLLAQAQQKATIHLDVQVENYTDMITVVVGEMVSGRGWHLKPAGDMPSDGHFMKDVEVNLPAGEEHVKLAFVVWGPGWDEKIRYFYAHPGSQILVTAQDKQPQTIQIQSDEELDKTYRQFLELTAKSTALLGECEQKIDSLTSIVVETDEEYVPIENALTDWKAKKEDAYIEEVREQLLATQQLPFNGAWKDIFSDVTHLFIFEKYQVFRPLAEEILKTIPFEEKSTRWYINQLSLIRPGEVYAMDDEVDAELEDLDGNSYTLNQFRGKFVLLDFWGEGCDPCDQAMPELAALSKELEDQIVFISITDDYNDSNWRTATNRHTKEEFCWYNLRDKAGHGGLWARNAINSMPTFVLLSPEGNKIDQHAGYSTGRIFSFLKPHLNLKSEVSVTFQNKSDKPSVNFFAIMANDGCYQIVKKDTLALTDHLEACFPVNRINMLSFDCPGIGKLEFPIERDEHFSLTFTGNSLLLDEADAHPAQKFYAELYTEPDAVKYASAFMKYDTAESLKAAIDEEWQPIQDQLLQTHKEKRIGTDMYTFIQHDIDCFWKTIMGTVSNHHLAAGNKEEAEKMWKMATEGVNSDARMFIDSHSINDYLKMKAERLLYKDLEKTGEMNTDGWSTAAYVEKYKRFLKDEHLEHQYAYCLYQAMMQENPEPELNDLLQDFWELFPESLYLPVLSSLLGQEKSSF